MDNKKKTKKQIIAEQAAAQALPPTPPPDFITQAIKDAKESRPKPENKDDNIIAAGATSDFWKLIKGYIVRTQLELKKQTTLAVVKSGYKLEEAGFRYVLLDQLTNYADDIINYVENRAKVVEAMKLKEAERQKKIAEAKAKKKVT